MASPHLSCQRASLWVLACLLGTLAAGSQVQAEELPVELALEVAAPSPASSALANAFAGLVSSAIPTEYERRKDWGKTKRMISGLKFEDFDIKRRQKPVKHGVWKHYKVRLRDPDHKLRVKIDRLEALDGSRVRFTLAVQADLDFWGRAKVYEYGVHLIALEIVGHTTMDVTLDCEIGARLEPETLLPAVVIDPRVTAARLELSHFRIERISNAHGPLVKELSGGVEQWIEEELAGPKLVGKLNRAIEKRRDSLRLSPSQLVDSSWWPLAELPEVAPAVLK